MYRDGQETSVSFHCEMRRGKWRFSGSAQVLATRKQSTITQETPFAL